MALIDGIQEVLPDVAENAFVAGRPGLFSALDVARLLMARGYLSDKWGGRPSRMQLSLVRTVMLKNASRLDLRVHRIGNTVYFTSVASPDDVPLL